MLTICGRNRKFPIGCMGELRWVQKVAVSFELMVPLETINFEHFCGTLSIVDATQSIWNDSPRRITYL